MSAPPDRKADARLAWTIVGGSAALTLMLAVALGWLMRGPAKRWAAEQARALAVGMRPGPDAPAGMLQMPPPNTAHPIGSVSDWVGSDAYPAGALSRGEEGRVRVTLAIDAAGVPTGCQVALSSGFWSLDNGTCLALMRAGRFDRARPGGPGSREGEVRRWTSPAIRWQLPS